jgi:hypothetical protein
MNQFSDGQLLVPNDILSAAFYYYKNERELDEDVEYRVATTTERIYFEKTLNSGREATNSIQDYKAAKSKKVSEITNPNNANNDKPNGRF